MRVQCKLDLESSCVQEGRGREEAVWSEDGAGLIVETAPVVRHADHSRIHLS